MGGGQSEMVTIGNTDMVTKPMEDEENDTENKNDDLYSTNASAAPIAFSANEEVELVNGDDDADSDEGGAAAAVTYVDREDDEKEDANESDDELLTDERYTAVRMFFENEVLVIRSVRIKYFKLCIQNGIDSLEALKAVNKDRLVDIGIDPLDVGTMLIKAKMIKLNR